MIFVGIDDTDLVDFPGTNQLARHLVRQLQPRWLGKVVTRHQLLEDPRVPCTSRNGCAAIVFEGDDDAAPLADAITRLMLPWCPKGSDPGLCVTRSVPPAIVEFGRRCQHEFVVQNDARSLARQHGVYLEGLGGTQDGVIGALAAVGLHETGNDGRVIYLDTSGLDLFDVSGRTSLAALQSYGVDEVRCVMSTQIVDRGWVDVGKRLRPNLRSGKVVLFVNDVARDEADGLCWEAVRVT